MPTRTARTFALAANSRNSHTRASMRPLPCLTSLGLSFPLQQTWRLACSAGSSSDLPKLPQAFTGIMSRFNALVEEVTVYCKSYATEGVWATASRFLLHLKHKQHYDELVSELRGLTADATFALGVDHNRMLKEFNDKLNAGMPSVPDEDLEKCMDRLEVRWGVWWTVFPGKLALDKTLDEAAREKLVGLLKDKDSKDPFKRAVEQEDTIYISIDELCLSFPDNSPLLWTVNALLCEGRDLVREDAVKAQNQEKMAMAEAGRNQKLTPVKKERAPSAALAQSEQGRQKGGPVQGGAQLFLSYRVPETGRKEQGGDCTVPLLKSALEAHGYSVFVGESDIEGGASWVQTIQVAITDCQVFIPVCSKTYGDTKWTLRELHAADEANKEILPLWHSGDYPPSKVRLYLGNLQRLPRGNQPLVQADLQSLVSHLVAAIKKAGCLPRNPPGPSNQALQGPALDQGRRRT
ncbi:hypothetical protein V8C86DRAFT_997394 [Haematococcus lacustris]